MKSKKLSIVAISTAIALAITGCSSSGDDAGGDLNIALVSKGFQHQFWQAVQKGAESAAADLGVTITYEGPESESQVDKQLEMLQAAIDRKVSAIAYASLDPKAPLPLLAKAKEAKIPVYMFDAAAGDEKDLGADGPALGIARTDGEAAAALAADEMAKLVGPKGKVFVIVHSQTNATGVQRRDGFINQMKAKHPGITVLAPQYGDGDHQKSADIVKAVLASNKDLKGIYATNEGSAIGAVKALQELKKKPGELALIGFDSGAAQINAIKDGLMAGAITQDPIGIGYKTVEALVKFLKDGTVPPTFIDTGFYYYTKDNMEEPNIAAVLYQ